jgi:hypothetical protein
LWAAVKLPALRTSAQTDLWSSIERGHELMAACSRWPSSPPTDSAGASEIVAGIRKPWLNHLFVDAAYDRTRLIHVVTGSLLLRGIAHPWDFSNRLWEVDLRDSHSTTWILLDQTAKWDILSLVEQSKDADMRNPKAPSGRLTAVELASIDFAITVLQAAGHSINDVAKDDNPRQQQAEAWMDAHHPLAELTDRDREIIRQIKDLAGQLSPRISLPGLLEAREKIIRRSWRLRLWHVSVK